MSHVEADQLQRSSSEEELERSRQRRISVRYATIGEFLASLRSVQDTGGAQGVKALSLDDYLRAVRSPEIQPPGDGAAVKVLVGDGREQARD